MPAVHRILLVAGGSASALAASQFALQFSGQTGAHVLAVYVVDTDSLDLLQSKGIFLEDECKEFSADMEEKGNRYLERIRHYGEAQGISVDTELIKGRFVKSIIGMVKEQQTDMLVMGSWDNSIRSKDMSVRLRQTVVNTVECPVVLVKGN